MRNSKLYVKDLVGMGYKPLKKKQLGGVWADPSLYAGMGMATDQMFDAVSPPDEFGYSKGMVGKSAATGALSGAAAGTAILPGIGTAVGAVVGGVTGWLGGSKKKREAERAEKRYNNMLVKNERLQSNAKSLGYNPLGEGENSALVSAAFGGDLKPLASDIVEVDGRKHSEGGVKFPSKGIELEDNETVSGDYVFSDVLGFADKHKRLAKQIGKIEKKPLNRETRVSLEILRKKEESLKQQQEEIREALGLGEGAGFLQLGGDLLASTKPLVLPPATDPTNPPTFKSAQEYNAYHRALALKRMKPEDVELYNKELEHSQANADAIIALRDPSGGWKPYKKPLSKNPPVPYGNVLGRAYGLKFGGFIPLKGRLTHPEFKL